MISMQLPKNFIKNVRRIYGDIGEKWLVQLPNIIQESISNWKIHDYKLMNNFSNAVIFGISDLYGDIVLKICIDRETEINSYVKLGQRDLCKMHDYYLPYGALLLERLVANKDLTSVSSEDERIRVASEMMLSIPSPASANLEFGEYLPRFERTFSKAQNNNRSSSELLEIILIAKKQLVQIQKLERPLYLLHGDLHHENILQSYSKDWKAIDPQSVIGYQFQESSRFIINQVRMTEPDEKNASLVKMVSKFADIFHEEPFTILKNAFIDHVQIVCYMNECNDDKSDILKALNDCHVYLDVMKSY